MRIDKHMTPVEKAIHDVYVGYRNDFLTSEAFASFYGYDNETAEKLLDLGRHIDTRHTELNEVEK